MKTRDSKKKWFCDECRKAKGTSSINSSKLGEQATTLTKEFMIGLFEAFKKEVSDELKSHSTQFQDFKTALDFFSAKLDDSNKAMAEIQTQYKEIRRENEAFKVQNAQLSQRVGALETKVRDLEQYSRRDNIEINGLPEIPGENSMSILQDIGRAIGVEVEPSTIVAVHRVPTFSRTRTPPLIVRFTTRDKRDEWQHNEKKKTLMARDVNRNFPATKVFIN
ncbi:uncharacterized protein LOC124369531 [Homalodisca vitripennis]|uniref:uncharacterized protein LOC124369531 n=1 Tax=Homalodisca vitripennis TaxID=197043 RepID=UPI001EEA1EBE|nr:uncharacterized protein LOC124369531 [Homalodisca vitripennis]